MILANPYFRSGSIVAQLAVNAATLLWSTIVLWRREALIGSGDPYGWIIVYVDEQHIALVLYTLCLVQVGWLILKLPPFEWRRLPVGSFGYLALSVWWAFVTANAVLIWSVQPALTAAGATVCALALFGFLANARRAPTPNALPAQ